MHPAPTLPTAAAPPGTAREAIATARALRPTLAELAPPVDATAEDATEAMAVLGAAGVQALNVPVEYGGLMPDGQWGGFVDFLSAGMEVAAADGAVGQLWLQGGLVHRAVLTTTAAAQRAATTSTGSGVTPAPSPATTPTTRRAR